MIIKIIPRLKAIKKQSGHVSAQNDEEKVVASDLKKDLLRRNEQLSQVSVTFEYFSKNWSDQRKNLKSAFYF